MNILEINFSGIFLFNFTIMDVTANKTFFKRIIKHYNKYHFSCFTIKDIDSIEIGGNYFNITFNNSTKGQIYFYEIN